jgi:hypothetical protein
MNSVFISYSREDEAIAQALTKELKVRGLSVFVDRAIAAGEDFVHHTRVALQAAEIVVVLLSKNSLRSRWIKDEVATALESRKQVIPVLLDAAGKENWVWPLLADRLAVTVNSDADVHQLAANIARSIGHRPEEGTAMMRPPDATPMAASSARWPFIAVAVIAALLGALLTLLLTS